MISDEELILKVQNGDEAAECRSCLQRRMESIGYEVVTDRGDSKVVCRGRTRAGADSAVTDITGKDRKRKEVDDYVQCKIHESGRVYR